MTAPILAAKLYRPAHRPNGVWRRRLTDKLNQGLYRKLTLISAPAGYGKTTLISQWLDSCDRPSAWLSLEETDGDAVRFLIGLLSALRTIEAGLGADLLAVLQSPQPPPTDALLDAIAAELAALPMPGVLVLDDYHAVHSREVDALLLSLLELLPPHLHLVITTRETPNLPLARLRARDQLTELRAADLRFTADEAARFLNEAMSLGLSPSQVSALESGTEGWIAGLHLAALSLEGEGDAERWIRSFAGTHRYVLDYLAEEVLRRQPEVRQAFLLRTSILDRLCGPLCDALLPELEAEGHAGERLIELDAKNLFVVPLDQERRWYRYHHLFADLLRGMLRSRCTEAEIAELHRRASLWYERHSDELEAFRHAALSGDTDRAAHLLEGGGMPLHLRGASGSVLSWLESLPAEALDARPSLWAIYGSALLMAGRLTEIEPKLRAAEAAMGTGDQQGSRAGWPEGPEQQGLQEQGSGQVVADYPGRGEDQNEGREQDDGQPQDAGPNRGRPDRPGRDSDRGWIGLVAATRAAVVSLSLTGRLGTGSSAQLALLEAEADLRGAGSDSVDDKTDALIGRIAPSGGARIVRLPPDERSKTEAVVFQCRRALEHLQPEQLPIRLASAWMLGVACETLGDLPAARAAYEEAVASSRVLGEPTLAVTATVGLARLDEAGQRFRAAEQHYREAKLELERAERGGDRPEPLSPRELEVLGLIAEGLSNREIGERLFLSLDTVKGHNRRIFEKLQVQRRTEAVARANEWHLLADAADPH